MKRYIIFVIICYLMLNLVVAFGANSTGTVGYEFLRTEIGARSAALGGAFVAVSGDLNSVYYNPGGIADIDTRVGTISYLKHLLDFHSGNIVGAMPFSWGTMGLGFHYMNFGEFKRTTREDPEGASGETFGAQSLVFSLSAGKKYKNLFSYGSTVKFIQSSIDQYSATAFAVDLGVIFHMPVGDDDHLNIAASVSNIGQTQSTYIKTKDDLPMVIRAGVSKKLAHLPLLFGAQIYKYIDDDYRWALGGEFILSPRMFLRLGFNSIGLDQRVGTAGDRLAGANFGFGLLWQKYRFDYTFSSVGDVGSLNRIAISGAF
ncbi:PorV/PorQ family protein [candidate division KSB1 bacterium]|nr:PorV/PorQ family protein [candidate division KSB1 bacterium]